MDEMRLIQELGAETPMPTSDRLARARDQLAVVMAERPGTAAPTVRPPRRRFGWRLAWTAFAGATSAAIAVAVYVLVPDQVGGDVPAANAQAAQVLHQAAATALRIPDVEPRADQFIYVKTQSGEQIDESWLSVDGTRDGLVLGQWNGRTERSPLAGCRDGRRAAVKGGQMHPTQTEPCVPEPGYVKDLPTDADAVLPYLEARTNPGDINDLGKYVLDLAGHSYLRSSARAALFDAVAEIPGLTVVERAIDGTGRPGVGIAWSSGDKSGLLVFDAGTHDFLGTPESAVLTIDVVDKVGARN